MTNAINELKQYNEQLARQNMNFQQEILYLREQLKSRVPAQIKVSSLNEPKSPHFKPAPKVMEQRFEVHNEQSSESEESKNKESSSDSSHSVDDEEQELEQPKAKQLIFSHFITSLNKLVSSISLIM